MRCRRSQTAFSITGRSVLRWKKRLDSQRDVRCHITLRSDSTSWFAKHSVAGGADPGAAVNARGYSKGRVILWDDTFVRYYEPQIGIAAVKVLEALGFEVSLRKEPCAAADDQRLVREIWTPRRNWEKTMWTFSHHSIMPVRRGRPSRQFCSSSRRAGRCSWKIIAS